MVIWGDAKEKEILKEAGISRAANLICFLPGEQSGIEVLSAVHDFFKNKKVDSSQLNFYLHLSNPRLIDVIEKAEHLSHFKNHGLDVRFFNFDKMIARQLFHSFVTHHYNDIAGLQAGTFFRLIIFDFENAGKALLLQALRIMHFQSSRLTEVVIIDSDISNKQKKFTEAYPFIQNIFPVIFEEFDGTYQSLIKKYVLTNEDVIPAVIASFKKNDTNLALALEILQYTPDESFKIYTRNGDSKNLSALLKKAGDNNRRLLFFGDMETFCRVEYITGNEQDRLAQLIHADYLEQQKIAVASESERYKTLWHDLPEDARDANRAQADHLLLKLAQASVKPDDLNPGEMLNASRVEALAIAEHNRWCAHRYINGWQFGQVRDDINKLHPSLVPWEQLSEGEKQKDRNAVLRIPLLVSQAKEMINVNI